MIVGFYWCPFLHEINAIGRSHKFVEDMEAFRIHMNSKFSTNYDYLAFIESTFCIRHTHIPLIHQFVFLKKLLLKHGFAITSPLDISFFISYIFFHVYFHYKSLLVVYCVLFPHLPAWVWSKLFCTMGIFLSQTMRFTSCITQTWQGTYRGCRRWWVCQLWRNMQMFIYMGNYNPQERRLKWTPGIGIEIWHF